MTEKLATGSWATAVSQALKYNTTPVTALEASLFAFSKIGPHSLNDRSVVYGQHRGFQGYKMLQDMFNDV